MEIAIIDGGIGEEEMRAIPDRHKRIAEYSNAGLASMGESAATRERSG